MSKTILITGGSGLIGSFLTHVLLQKGYIVHHLRRNEAQSRNPAIRTFEWDVYRQQIDEKCIDEVDAVVHLAGEGIADKRWTNKRKQQIVESRTESIRMVYGLLKKKKDHQCKLIVSASGIGYYGDCGEALLTEDNPPGSDFLAQTCVKWEKAVDEGAKLGLRIVKFRTGVILAEQGGALPQMAKPVKWGFGAALGSGNQWMSWIHIRDAVRMYVFALEKQLEGIYNMVSPHPATNKQIMKAIASHLNHPFWLPDIPAFVLKVVMGEMGTMLLGSAKVSANKIQSTGFIFEFLTLQEALQEIYDGKI